MEKGGLACVPVSTNDDLHCVSVCEGAGVRTCAVVSVSVCAGKYSMYM